MGANPQLKAFTFVRIPSDTAEPLQEQRLETTEDKEVESLLDHLKEYFRAHGPQRTPAQVAQQRAELLANVPDDQRKNLDERTLQAALDMQMVENIALLSNAPDNGFVGVNMYVDDSGRSKGLPFNVRASDIGTTCGKPLEVRGDAFLARVLDDGERFERRDLIVADVSSTADWVRAAAAQNERKRREESADVKLSRMRQQQNTTGSASAEHTTASPAESAKAAGNLAFSAGKWDEAVEHYSRALQLDAQLLTAQNNRAMCWLKLGRFGEAVEDCDSVLGADACNVKALLRRGTAKQALGQLAEAAEDFCRVTELQPSNKEAHSRLAAIDTTPS